MAGYHLIFCKDAFHQRERERERERERQPDNFISTRGLFNYKELVSKKAVQRNTITKLQLTIQLQNLIITKNATVKCYSGD